MAKEPVVLEQIPGVHHVDDVQGLVELCVLQQRILAQAGSALQLVRQHLFEEVIRHPGAADGKPKILGEVVGAENMIRTHLNLPQVEATNAL